ncbi:MAG TPA: DUF4349 domain-containing protein [Anaerolineae bacterium]|jgi:hypothetical protein
MKQNLRAQIGGYVIGLIGVLAISACGAAATPSSLTRSQGVVQPAAPPSQADSEKAASGGASASGKVSAAQDTARMIVRNASLTLVVDDAQARSDALTAMVNGLGGYVATSKSTKFDAGLQTALTVRVPADKFDTAMASIRKLAIEVRDEQISGEDVTAEYTDLNAQLTNLQAAELQLRDIMSKTTKTEDVLAVFNQLTQKRGEIEQVKGRIQFLSQSAALATINVTMMPDALAQPIQVAGWRPEGVLKSAVQALIDALQAIATLVIWLVIVVLPVVAILASPFVALFLILRSRNKRKKMQQQSATAPTDKPVTK